MKTKFNEKDVPSWAKWIAVDGDGYCAYYSTKPKRREICKAWDNDHNPKGRWSCAYKGKKPKNWKDELYTWGY